MIFPPDKCCERNWETGRGPKFENWKGCRGAIDNKICIFLSVRDRVNSRNRASHSKLFSFSLSVVAHLYELDYRAQNITCWSIYSSTVNPGETQRKCGIQHGTRFRPEEKMATLRRSFNKSPLLLRPQQKGLTFRSLFFLCAHTYYQFAPTNRLLCCKLFRVFKYKSAHQACWKDVHVRFRVFNFGKSSFYHCS